jgi:putative lipoprotein (rSAM/lipoprotein system)
MKKPKSSYWSKSTSKLLVIFLSLLGFTVSCKHEDKYGTPMADFVLQGTVQSSATHNTLPDIQVKLNSISGQTNSAGYFEISMSDYPDPHTYTLQFHDLDTINNGYFKDKDTSFYFPANSFQGGDDEWYEGKEIKITEIHLDPAP